MTEEHAKLLLKDLSSRLPYGVKLQISSWDDEKMEYVDKVDTLYSISSDNHVRTSSEDRDFYIDEVKPYLFPMSSMTEKQIEELEELCDIYSPDDDYRPYAYLGINVLYKHVRYLDYDGEGPYVLVTEDDKCIGSHYCSSRDWANHDLTEWRLEELKENNISEVYSNGKLVWSDYEEILKEII